MEPTKDSDTLSGIEPLESSAATSALLLASPGSINSGKLSLSFGSYHSSLQSSPKNPDQFRHGITPGSRELEQAISPLHPSEPNSQFAVLPNTRTNNRGNHKFTQPTNPINKTNATSLPATPFTNDAMVDESKRLMASVDELRVPDRYTQPHQNANPYQYNQTGNPDTVHQSLTKRELFSKPPPVNVANTTRLPSSSAAYTSASRSYRSYGGAFDDKSTAVLREPTTDHGTVYERNTNSSILPRNRLSVQEPKSNPVSSKASMRSYPEIKSTTIEDHQSPAQQEIAEMERVRESLHQMLGTSPRYEEESRNSTPTDLLAGALSRPKPSDSWDSVKTDVLISARPIHDVSPMGLDSGFDLSAFRSLASNVSRDVAETDGRDTTLHAENHMLRDSLEKERYRRKHCEKQIADLQSKLLETQQQLAVAISTDKKKDAMIEQLDKTLARLVDGWKKQDHEKVHAIGQLKMEKETAEAKLQELQTLYINQTSEVNAVKETLQDIERQNTLATEELEAQIASLHHERSSLTEQLQTEQQKLQDIRKEHEAAVNMWQRLQRELRQTQESLLQEKDNCQTAEERLQEQIESLDKENKQELSREKARAEDQTQKAHEACGMLTAVQRDVDKLKEQLESALRENENVRLELSLQEARFEAAQRKHEAEWQDDMDKTLNRRLTELQERAQHTETDMQESHRGQIGNLQEQQQREMDELRRVQDEEIKQREKRLETLRHQYQERLDENQEELSKMTNKMEDTQHEKTLLVGKLQDVLQAYYSGTLLNTSSQSATPTQQSQTTSPTIRRDIVTRDLFENAPQHQMLEHPPTTPVRHQLLEKRQDFGMDFDKGLGSKRDTRTDLTASQIAALHTTVHLQHKHYQQQNKTTNSSSLNTNKNRLHFSVDDAVRNSPTALSEHEISHISRAHTHPGDTSLVSRDFQYPQDDTRTQKSHNAMHQTVSQNAPESTAKRFTFRDSNLPSGAQPIRLQSSGGHTVPTGGAVDASRLQDIFGDNFKAKQHVREQLATLEQDPDRSGDFDGESFSYARGYASGEFLPLKALAGSPTGSILSTGLISEAVSDLSSAPLNPTKSNVMLLEKLAEHEQRQLALQHYIQMLLQRSPGTSEEVRSTTNKPADNSVVIKERLPAPNDNPHWHIQRPESDVKAREQQHPSHQKAAPSARTTNLHDRHTPAERLQPSKPSVTQQQANSTRMASGIAANRQGMKARTTSSAQPSSSGRPSITRSGKPTTVSGRSTTATTRLSAKGKATRVAPSDKRGSAGADSTGKKRGGRGKETR